MGVDVQVFVWKMIKISSKTCFNVSRKYPYITSCLLFLILLYTCCPQLFWIFIYSLPLLLCLWAALKIYGRKHKTEKEKEKEKERETSDMKTKSAAQDRSKLDSRNKAFSRVHSVRRRKAKEIAMDGEGAAARTTAFSSGIPAEEEEEEEERNAAVEKRALVEESPKEIHEVKVDETSTNHKFCHDPDLMILLRDDGDATDEANKAMDVSISDSERIKRLESLIARRKSRKVLNQQVRRSLMSMDAQIAPIIVPKINTSSRAGDGPVPGSAPSMPIPMRNPFNLPYDPQEEKPDLRGDSFQQEFALGPSRDMMFCRHESFCLGPSLPLGLFDDGDDMPSSSVDWLGSRRRRPSAGDQLSKPQNEESDTDFGITTDAESNIDSLDDDDDDDGQIKEVIQVHENVADDKGKKPIPQDEVSSRSRSSTSSNSSSNSQDSSVDERPVRIINREAILKSLSMRRNSVDIDATENLQENNLTYANSALENASRLKQEYFAHKPQKRPAMTFSIASDMQVEVSELSSPPLTVDENMSYASTFDGEMDRNNSSDGLDSWAGSSRLSEVSDNEMRLPRPNEAGSSRSRRPGTAAPLSENHSIHSSSSAAEFSNNGESQTAFLLGQNASAEDNVNVEPLPTQRGEGEDEGEARNNPGAVDSNESQTIISPKSVLQPAFSVASFEPDADGEAQLSRAQSVTPNPTSLVQFAVATSSGGDEIASQEECSSTSSDASSSGESSVSNGKQKILEDVEETKEPPAQTVDDKLKIQEDSEDFEGANPTDQRIDNSSEKEEMGNSSPQEDTGHGHEHEHDSSKPEDL